MAHWDWGRNTGLTANKSEKIEESRARKKEGRMVRKNMLRYIVLVFLVLQVSETEVNGQFESVCESVFSEVESQAMDALDLPGCFRTRSHSYLRAIQAGFSQDDDCVPSMTSSTVTSTIRSTTGKWAFLEHNHAHLCLVSACVCLKVEVAEGFQRTCLLFSLKLT